MSEKVEKAQEEVKQ
jgi:hypothetical protein